MPSSASESAVLHWVVRSPLMDRALQRALTALAKNHALVLLQAAVVAALVGEEAGWIEQVDSSVSLYVVGPDLNARGLQSRLLHQRIQIIDYAELVQLACAYPLSHTWF